MSFTHSVSTNNYGPSRIIIDPNPANGTHTTFASAIAAANAGDVIVIRPATYVESFTVTKNLTFYAFDSSFRIGERVTMLGKVTISASNVEAGFYGIKFETNSDNSINLTGTSSSVTCQDCYFLADSANSINVTGDGGTNLYIENCSGSFSSTFSLYTASGGFIWLKNSLFADAVTPGTSTNSASVVYIFDSSLIFPISTTSVGSIVVKNSTFGSQVSPFTNTTWVTTAGSGTSVIDKCTLNSGTASAISIGTGTTVIATEIVVNSSNTNAITGAGTIQYGAIDFAGSSSTINTTTQTPLITKVGNLTSGPPNSGVTNTLTVSNASNTASSQAQVNVTVGGATSGDAYTTYTVSGVTNWSEGVDNSDSDAYVLAASNALGTTNVIRAATGGSINYPLQPSFLAFLSASTANNVTGDGTVFTVICNTVTTNVGSGYSGSTGVFTAPVTGNYLFTFSCNMQNLGAGHTNNQVRIITTGATFVGSIFGFTAAGTGTGGTYTSSFSVICPMTATNTASFVALAQNSTKTVGIQGGSSPLITFVSGMLVS